MANGRVSKSPYARGKRFMALLMLSLLLIMWGIPILGSKLGGWDGNTTLAVVMPLAFGWFAIGAIGSFVIACPRCGRSVFRRGLMMSVPWPARACTKCGYDVAAPGQSEQKA